MGLFTFVKKKLDMNKKENEWPYYDPTKRICIPNEIIDAAQRVWASDAYCEKVYRKFYSDFPEKPFISKDREIYTNWLEEMDSLEPHELVDISMMERYQDGLLPGEVYMLYWIDKLHCKRIPSYFEYKCGIEFIEHRAILQRQGYLDSDYKVTEKGGTVLQKYRSLLPKKMICIACGQEIERTDGYCPSCGLPNRFFELLKPPVTTSDMPNRFLGPLEPPVTISDMHKKNEKIPSKVTKNVEKIIDKEFKGKRYLGMCHQVWRREKELYKEFGYEWYSPQDLNPNIYFD